MLKTILSISGKPGLYKLISQGKNMLIVETIDAAKKRFPAYGNEKIISLADIAMYTNDSIRTKEVGYGKEDFRSDLFVDSAFAALFAYRDYNDLLFYRGKSAGQLDRILHKTVFVTVHYRHSPFADECADQYCDHCFDCSYGFHPAGEYHRYRHLQPEGTFAEGHQLCEQHSYPEWGYYYRYFTVSVVCVAGDIAGIHDRCHASSQRHPVRIHHEAVSQSAGTQGEL